MNRPRDRRAKPIDGILLDSLAAYVARFTVAESTLFFAKLNGAEMRSHARCDIQE